MLSSSSCTHLTNPNPYTVTLASIILIGILISYLPQHLKIITRRSSSGLSPWWVLLGGLSAIAAIANILVLPASRADMRCCNEVNGGECAAALLGVAQIGLQWGCFMFIVMLFLIFFPTDSEVDMVSSTASLTQSSPPKRRDAVIVGVSMLLALLVVGITSIAIIFRFPTATSQAWANTLGSLAGAMAMVQYLPQIYFTWRMGEIGSLSIITMLIQVPGAFLFAFSLWLRVGWEGWSAWFVFLVTGFLQAFLLALAIKYFFADRKARLEGDGGQSETDDEDEEANEQTALLANGRHAASKPATQSGDEIRT